VISDTRHIPAAIPGMRDGFVGDYIGIVSHNNKTYPVWVDNREIAEDANARRYQLYTSPIDYSALAVHINQTLSNGGIIGDVKKWNGSQFISVGTLPVMLPFPSENLLTLLGDQNVLQSQKHEIWKVNGHPSPDVVNHRSFTINPNTNDLLSQFTPAYNATLQAQLIEGGNGYVDFKDPWLIDYPDLSYGSTLRNRGMNALYYSVESSGNNLGLGTAHQGVLLGKGGFLNPIVPPYYSINAPLWQQFGALRGFFTGWQSTGADLNASNETPVIFRSANASVIAQYKAHQLSTSSSATASNNQRKIAYCDGVSYMVYESGGEIWLTSSTTDGASWSNETRLSDGSGLNRQPSIVGGSVIGGSNVVDIAVVWERFEYYPQLGVGDVTIKMRLCNRSPRYWGAPINIAYEIVPQNYSGSTPVVALSMGYVAVAFTANDDPEFMGDIGGTGVFFINYLTTSNPSVIEPCTNFLRIAGEGSAFPSLVSKSANWYNFGIAWKDGPCIYYQTYSTYDQIFTSVELVEEMLVVGGPSLADENVNQYDNPLVAWHTWDYIYGPCYLIACKQRGEFGWDTPSVMYGGQNSNYRDPSVAHARNTQTSAALVWHNYSDIYQAKYTTAWQPAEYKSAGVYPTLREENHATSGTYCLAYMWGSQTPWLVSTTNEGFIGGGGHHGEEKIIANKDVPLHRLDFLHNNRRHSIIINAKVGVSDKKNHINFNPKNSSLSQVSLSESFAVASGMHLLLDIDYGNKKIDEKKNVVHVDMSLELEIVDAATNTNLSKLPLSILDIDHPSKSYQIDLSSMAGKSVKISIISPIWQADSVKIKPSTFFFDGNRDSVRTARGKEMQNISLEIPKEYNLAQNYPNPFNPVTTIQYSLKAPSSVTLEIFDMLGRKVATLVNEHKPAGMYTIRWEASRASSGLYFYKINVIGENGRLEYQKTLKMLLLR
jgi:hypothetical protein